MLFVFGGLAIQKDDLLFFPSFEEVLFPKVIHLILGAMSPRDEVVPFLGEG
jgi:hypothetical protein